MLDFIDFDSLGLWLVFVSAISLSFSHCGGMCGSIVIAYTSIKNAKNPKILSIKSFFSHIAYNLGRLCSYVIIGIVFAFLGEGVAFSFFARSFLEIFIGILLVGYAICFAFFPKVLRAIEPNLSKAGIFGQIFGRLLFSPNVASYFALGILSGFLPCGVVYFFALNALNAGLAGTQAIFSSVVIMVVFWAGTLPLMLGIGTISNAIKSYQHIFFKISFLLMLSVGLFSIYKGIISN
ncbi:sulfite exporter TauE/SafE family protein [Helicobacter sp. T3_23-1056]